jgi:DNA-binding GntR family transcriptional regulator
MLGAALRAADWASTRERLHGEHQAILAAVAAGRGRRAAELVERHLRSFYDEHLGVGRRR